MVGQKRSNAWGLYDMHGNLYEWVEDWYGVYPTGSVTDPTGPPSSGRCHPLIGCSERVIRGGSWTHTRRSTLSAERHHASPGFRPNWSGFRLVRTAK